MEKRLSRSFFAGVFFFMFVSGRKVFILHCGAKTKGLFSRSETKLLFESLNIVKHAIDMSRFSQLQYILRA